MKYFPWTIVVALTLGFGLFCRQEGIAHEKNKATIAALATTHAQLQHDFGQVLQQNDSLKAENAKRDVALKIAQRRERVVQLKFDSLLAAWPLDSAPVSCFPYVQQVTTCQELAQNLHGQVDTLTKSKQAETTRADSNLALANRNRKTADSLLTAWPKPSLFKDLTRPGSWLTFVAGLLVGIKLSK